MHFLYRFRAKKMMTKHPMIPIATYISEISSFIIESTITIRFKRNKNTIDAYVSLQKRYLFLKITFKSPSISYCFMVEYSFSILGSGNVKLRLFLNLIRL